MVKGGKLAVSKKFVNLSRLFQFMRKGHVVDKDLSGVCSLTRTDTKDFPNFKKYNENRKLFEMLDEDLDKKVDEID